MLFDDLSPGTLILLGILLPPLLTLICWFGGRRLVRKQQQWTEVPQTKGGFWGLLFAAYILCALALYSSRFFAGTAHADPTVQLIQ
jgi:hypothetical protein